MFTGLTRWKTIFGCINFSFGCDSIYLLFYISTFVESMKLFQLYGAIFRHLRIQDVHSAT